MFYSISLSEIEREDNIKCKMGEESKLMGQDEEGGSQDVIKSET